VSLDKLDQNAELLFRYYPSLFMPANCIQSQPELYAISTLPPRDLSALSLFSPNHTSIELKWEQPKEPNDYRLDYLIYRRDSCPFSERNNDILIQLNSSSNCDKEDNNTKVTDANVISCMGVLYERRHGFACCGTNYIEKLSNTSQVCCGGKFYKSYADFQCCASLYYVHVPPGQLCCFSLNAYNEIRFSIGNGNKCCGDIPYYDDSGNFKYRNV
jgi:usherin